MASRERLVAKVVIAGSNTNTQ